MKDIHEAYEELNALCSKLEAENAECQRKAAVLDWLMANVNIIYSIEVSCRNDWKVHYENGFGNDAETAWHPTILAAIEAAKEE
jgi:hypothetical protein